MDPYVYTYESPLHGWEGLEPLPTEIAADGKSFVNPPAKTASEAYKEFVDPLDKSERGGFDIHVYFQQTNEYETKFARELHERIRREFPELRIYKVWDKPIGPHPVGMFEVNLFTPAQFGAFIPWLVINRGPLSALLHPNTQEEYRDHSQRATWLGTPMPLQLGTMRVYLENKTSKEAAQPKGEAN